MDRHGVQPCPVQRSPRRMQFSRPQRAERAAQMHPARASTSNGSRRPKSSFARPSPRRPAQRPQARAVSQRRRDGPGAVHAALKYASALANGYSDPNKLHEVYTIPHQGDVRAGLAQAIQKGDVKSWLNRWFRRPTNIARWARPISTSAAGFKGADAANSRGQADEAAVA